MCKVKDIIRRIFKYEAEVIVEYFYIYGGLKPLIRSASFLISIIATLISVKIWLTDEWWLIPISVLPNIIGFSIGGYAILVSFGDDKFKEGISGKDPGETDESPYMHFNASMVHAIITQIISVVLALLFKGVSFISYYEMSKSGGWHFLMYVPGIAVSFVCYFVFLYSLFLLIPMALNIFEVAKWYDSNQTEKRSRMSRNDPET